MSAARPHAHVQVEEATKNTAVSSAIRGISSSRIRHAPSIASNPATTKPPSHHGLVNVPSETCMAKIGGKIVAGITVGILRNDATRRSRKLVAQASRLCRTNTGETPVLRKMRRTAQRSNNGRLYLPAGCAVFSSTNTQMVARCFTGKLLPPCSFLPALCWAVRHHQPPFGQSAGDDAVGIGLGRARDVFIGGQLLRRRGIVMLDLDQGAGQRFALRQCLRLKYHPGLGTVKPSERHHLQGLAGNCIPAFLRLNV